MDRVPMTERMAKVIKIPNFLALVVVVPIFI
jgi:hypothetical protein